VEEEWDSPGPLEHDWGGDNACQGDSCRFRRNVRLTALGPGGTDSTQSSVEVTCSGAASLSLEEGPVPIALEDLLNVDSNEDVRGNVALNGAPLEASGSGVPTSRRLEALPGENTLTAWIRGAHRGGFWRFDFSGARAFVPFSIEAAEGAVQSSDATSVTFRLSEGASAYVRFRFRVSR